MENNRVPNNKASSVSASKKKSKNKHRYDYLWIASLIYLILGFFNIMFAWLGLACFFIPPPQGAGGGRWFGKELGNFAEKKAPPFRWNAALLALRRGNHGGGGLLVL